jgi:hypothetical protein
MKDYLTEYLPEQYEVCLAALDNIIRRAFNISETARDNREKLQALELYKDTHLEKLDLLSGSTTIDNALSYIRDKQEQKATTTTVTQDEESVSEEEDEKESAEQAQLELESDNANATGKHTVF